MKKYLTRTQRLLEAGKKEFYKSSALEKSEPSQSNNSPFQNESEGSDSEATSPCRSLGGNTLKGIIETGYPWEKKPQRIVPSKPQVSGNEKCLTYVHQERYILSQLSLGPQPPGTKLVNYSPSSCSSKSVLSNTNTSQCHQEKTSNSTVKQLSAAVAINNRSPVLLSNGRGEIHCNMLVESHCSTSGQKRKASNSNDRSQDIAPKESVKRAIHFTTKFSPSRHPICHETLSSSRSSERGSGISSIPKGKLISKGQEVVKWKAYPGRSRLSNSSPLKLAKQKDLSNLENLSELEMRGLKRSGTADTGHNKSPAPALLNKSPTGEIRSNILVESNCTYLDRKKKLLSSNGRSQEKAPHDEVKATLDSQFATVPPPSPPPSCHDASSSSRSSGKSNGTLSTPKGSSVTSHQQQKSSRKSLHDDESPANHSPTHVQSIKPTNPISRKCLTYGLIPVPCSSGGDSSAVLRKSLVSKVNPTPDCSPSRNTTFPVSHSKETLSGDVTLHKPTPRKSLSVDTDLASPLPLPQEATSNPVSPKKSLLDDFRSAQPSTSVARPLTYSELRQSNIRKIDQKFLQMTGRHIIRCTTNVGEKDAHDTSDAESSDPSWCASEEEYDSDESYEHRNSAKKKRSSRSKPSSNISNSGSKNKDKNPVRSQSNDDSNDDIHDINANSSKNPETSCSNVGISMELELHDDLDNQKATNNPATVLSATDSSDNRNESSGEERNESVVEAQPHHDGSEESSTSSQNLPFVQELAEPLSADDLEENNPNPAVKPKTSTQLKTERKLFRNSGKAYVNTCGNAVRARQRKRHFCIRLKCQDKISDEMAQALFDEYWQLASHDEQVQYIAYHVVSFPVQRKRKRHEDCDKEKFSSHKYYFDVLGERVPVCRSCFLGILDVTEKFVSTALANKKKTVSGVTKKDGRGRHPPKHKLSPEVATVVQNHIDSFPTYVSHYCRSQSKTKYFPSSLNYQVMYNLYLEAGNPKVSYTTYKNFVKATGKKFKKPKGDACSTCDKLRLKIEASPPGLMKRSIEIQLELHLRKAKMAYDVKRIKKEEASNNELMRVLVFDLEQVFPCPLLRCKDVFYLRQLSVYNLTIFDTKTKITSCYMWHEAEGDRGANQIGSCLFQHLTEKIPRGITQVALFSDCCTSQNRNSHISAMFHVVLQEHPTIQTIEHIFLVPGHTHLEVDNKHSVIERFKARKEKISVPEEWYALVKEAGMTDMTNFPDGKFEVVQMKQEFLNFAALLKGPLILRQNKTNQAKFCWLETHWFRYSKEMLGLVEVKEALNPESAFDTLSFLRRGVRKGAICRLRPLLEKCESNPLPISVLKKKDLLKMLCFLEEQHHAFYHGLTTDNSVEETDSDLPENSDDEDEISEQEDVSSSEEEDS